ncbi:hypothetical protein Tco_0473376, partial [Tanacetum coccineum]
WLWWRLISGGQERNQCNWMMWKSGNSLTALNRQTTSDDVEGEHRLDTYHHIEPKVQNKRSLAPDRRKAVTDEVNEWLEAGIVR